MASRNSDKKRFEQHHQNLKLIEEAIDSVQLELRRYISQQDERRTYIYTKILSHLVSSWIEVRVLTLAYEHMPFPSACSNSEDPRQWLTAFTSAEIDDILSASTFKDKWSTALDISISKAYKINRYKNILSQLGFTPRQRYIALQNVIDKELKESYEIRNRIAHGQWSYAFTNDLRNISTCLMGQIRQENIVYFNTPDSFLDGSTRLAELMSQGLVYFFKVSPAFNLGKKILPTTRSRLEPQNLLKFCPEYCYLQLRLKLFKNVAQTVQDLAISPPTFERDFDRNFKRIEEQRDNLHQRNYDDYKNRLIDKYKRGLQKRRNASLGKP